MDSLETRRDVISACNQVQYSGDTKPEICLIVASVWRHYSALQVKVVEIQLKYICHPLVDSVSNSGKERLVLLSASPVKFRRP